MPVDTLYKLESVFSYNPYYHRHGFEYAEEIVDELKRKGCKAKIDMGISTMRIYSDAAESVVAGAIEMVNKNLTEED